MTKIKNPLLSFGAVRALGNCLTFVRRRHRNIMEKTPIPQDAKSPAQLEWRHMYQKAVALWHALSANEKIEWESLARPKHMTGFAWFMSQCLRPNPGIYLPLQGGTMSGNIDMAKHRLLKLPEPVDDQEAARKIDIVGAATFLTLTDTPASYAAQAGKFPQVNVGEDALEFASAAADYPMIVKPTITRYVIPGWYTKGKSGSSTYAGRIFYIPIFVSETTTYTRICIHVEAFAAGTADLRIFNWSNGLPSSLVLSAGTVNTGSVGAKEIVISQELTRGYYFLAVRCTSNPVLYGPHPSYAILPPVPGISSVSDPDIYRIIPSVSAAYADPAPTPDTAFDITKASVYLKET